MRGKNMSPETMSAVSVAFQWAMRVERAKTMYDAHAYYINSVL